MERLKLTKSQKNAFNKKNMVNIRHMHRWFPLHYIDNTVETGAYPNYDGQHVVIVGTLLDVTKERVEGHNYRCKMHIRDRKSGNRVTVMHFFGGYQIHKEYHPLIGRQILCSGTLNYTDVYGFQFKKLDFISPEVDKNMIVIPKFRKVMDKGDAKVAEILNKSLEYDEEETISEDILNRYHLTGINTAISNVMAPKSLNDVITGRKRLLFDDLYYFHGKLELLSREKKNYGKKIKTTSLTDGIIETLPYALTNGQRETYEEIKKVMLNGEKLSALVQGDVGCGKTIVGFLCMLMMAENGYQAAIMAPTKILAQQHYSKLCDLVKGTNMEVALITGETITSEVIERIRSGKILLLVGTHALLSSKIEFHDLGALVIDEEHRFGVRQRDLIEEQCKAVDSISMSATPIPRTMANAMYGSDIRVYSIKDKPGCRSEVKTRCVNSKGFLGFIKKMLETGQQAYVVCPMINQGEKDSLMENVLSVKEAADTYRKYFPDTSIVELTGETEPEEMERILNDFRDNKIKILVSTTVIEVGVDVPNANLIIIHNAERFGLAQLHQLRGRVGRGDKQGYCIAVSEKAEDIKLSIFAGTTDGFEIAEQDLLCLRKSGDLFGTEQSGRNKYIDEIIIYPNLSERIKEIVKEIPTEGLKKHIEKIKSCEFSGFNKPIALRSF